MKKITTVLFDLDGTLLPQDQDEFIQTYFGALVRKMVPYGYDADRFTRAMWKGIGAMMKNDGSQTNEKVFWRVFPDAYGEDTRRHLSVFDEFYREDFDREVRGSCGFDARVAPTVKKIKEMGFRVAVATNPVFPSMATESRISWTGLSHTDFELFTSYENSSYSKPSLGYYREVLDKLSVTAEECLMVGNDTGDDMVAEQIGMKVFLLTDNLINKSGEDISRYPNGSFEELISFLEKMQQR